MLAKPSTFGKIFHPIREGNHERVLDVHEFGGHAVLVVALQRLREKAGTSGLPQHDRRTGEARHSQGYCVTDKIPMWRL